MLKKLILKQSIVNFYPNKKENFIERYSLPFLNKFIWVNVISKDLPEDMHNHVRSFISIILKGKYVEHILFKHKLKNKPIKKTRKLGSIFFRHHEDFHKITPIEKTYTLNILGPIKKPHINWFVDGQVMSETKYWLKKNIPKNHLRQCYNEQKQWTIY